MTVVETRRTLPFRPHSFVSKVVIERRAPEVVVSPPALRDMWHFVDIANDEVGWLGAVSITGDGSPLIEEVFLIEQEVSPTQTDLSAEGQAQLVQELLTNRDDGVEIANRLRFWGHSHVWMDTRPSYQDDSQMRLFRENGLPWFVRAIANKYGKISFDVFDWRTGVTFLDVPWMVETLFGTEGREEAEAAFASKVKSKAPAAKKSSVLQVSGQAFVAGGDYVG